MALPQQVQRAAEEAEALEKKLSDPESPSDSETGHEVNDQGTQDDAEVVRQRYASLQGKYNAEVPRLHSEKRDLEARLRQMEEENSALREEIATREANKEYITGEDTESFGEDMVDFVQRAAKQEAAKYAQEAAYLKSEVNRLSRMVEDSSNNATELRVKGFYDSLNQLLPDWEVQNTDQGFLDWLKVADPITGIIRQDILANASNELNASRVVAIFNQYRQEIAPAQNPLAKQVAPGKNRGAGNEPSSPHRWTEGEIREFYDKWTRNQIPNDQALEIEREIQDAVATGRVTA